MTALSASEGAAQGAAHPPAVVPNFDVKSVNGDWIVLWLWDSISTRGEGGREVWEDVEGNWCWDLGYEAGDMEMLAVGDGEGPIEIKMRPHFRARIIITPNSSWIIILLISFSSFPFPSLSLLDLRSGNAEWMRMFVAEVNGK